MINESSLKEKVLRVIPEIIGNGLAKIIDNKIDLKRLQEVNI